ADQHTNRENRQDAYFDPPADV
ncbi:MAG: hypothetical protein JWO85_2532, partial [Candidatus Eremiobacteraeota bacterium]|nr:hypothetical protein [Candidatus Eremiobacteraeota bacterium]